MNPAARKQSAQQARTQLTISLWMRFALSYGAALLALVAAISAFAGWHPADRVASAGVLLLLILELQVYGALHSEEIMNERAEYSKKIREIEIDQYEPKNDQLPMPRSFPLTETVAFHINRLRWLKRPWPLLADFLVGAVVVFWIALVTVVVIGIGYGVNYALVAYHLVDATH
jgi:hypothetical protein